MDRKLAGNAQSIINEMYDRCVNPMLFSLGADDTSRTAMESSGLLNRNRPPATTIRRRLLLEIESHQIEDGDGGAFKIKELKCSKLCHYNIDCNYRYCDKMKCSNCVTNSCNYR